MATRLATAGASGAATRAPAPPERPPVARAGLPAEGRSPRLPSLFAAWDTDGYCVQASAGHLQWFGLTPEQAVGRHVSAVLGPELYALNRPYLEGALAGLEQVYQSSVQDGAGRERHFEVTYVPDHGADGAVRGVFVQAVDVTSRVRAQVDLADAQELAGLGSWSWERGVGFAVSGEAAKIIGGDPRTWPGSTDAGVAAIHPDDREWLAQRHLAAVARCQGWEAEHRVLRPDGAVRHVHSRARVELDPDGRLLRTWGTVLDITEQTRLREEAESHNVRLSDTMAMLGHDVRQPLTAVLGFLEEAALVLQTDAADQDARVAAVTACVAKAGRAGARMRRLVDDILAVASVDAGTLVARPERVRVSELIQDVVEEVGVEAAVTGADGVQVRGDLFHLRQALTNLLVNATKYGMPPFEVAVRVVGGLVELTVEDHGAGVPAGFVPDLFERFSRGTRRARSNQASAGLGLHLVRSLIEANHGTVRYEGAPGRGARFVVTLPTA